MYMWVWMYVCKSVTHESRTTKTARSSGEVGLSNQEVSHTNCTADSDTAAELDLH